MKPILFSTAMVQAILDGRKTMTRRVMKDCTQFDIEEAELLENTGYNLTHNYKMSIESVGIFSTKEKLLNWFVAKYSKYQVGDVLWVRETFLSDYAIGGQEDDGTPINVIYRADSEDKGTYPKWTPSIFMPRKLARIFLRVTNVRVERLQDISVEDIKKEGAPLITITGNNEDFINSKLNGWWYDLWNSINGKGALEANPYVFVYEFERVEKPNIK